MLVIIFSGLLILPFLLIFFGTLFLKDRVPKKVLLVLFLATVFVTAVEMYSFYNKTHSLIDAKQWIIISDVLSVFPLMASLTVMAAGAIIVLILSYNAFLPKFRFAWIAVFVLAAVIRIISFNSVFDAFENSKKLMTVNLSEQEIDSVLLGTNLQEKMVLATRPDLSQASIIKMARNESEIIRFYAVQNPNISVMELEHMMNNDSAKEIRKQAGLEIKRRKVN